MKFQSDIEVQAGLKDSSGAAGTSGQVLSSNGTTVSWVNLDGVVASDVQNLVKAGVAINKGQAVYATSADGTNIIVGLASNVSEATSSKTLGLLDATVAINGMANVVQIGKLEGLNTSTATIGDPVWLGTNGNLIYGLASKPYAPNHLVFIGIVTRVNTNNGEIFVNVQNGFELNEIHDVDLKTTVPVNGHILGYNGTLWVNKTIAGWLGYTPQAALNGTGFVKIAGTTISYDNSTYLTSAVTSIATSGAILGGTITGTGTISHSTADGFLHVPATGTTNSGRVLTAGATAGSLSWSANIAGNAGTATTLQTTRSIALGTAVSSTATNFNGSANITIPVTGVSEAYLTWGGRNLSGTYAPIDAALMSDLRANRLAFTAASAVTIEYSQDGGTTWLNYAVSDSVKINLLNGNSATIQVGGGGYAVGTDYTNYLVRVTINTAGQIYTALNKFIILASTNGSSGSYCTIDARTQSNYLASVNAWTIFSNQTPISGWSGYNVINTSNITTFGNTAATQFGQVRFTFGQTGYNAAYTGLQIIKLLGFGGVGWQTPSTLAATGNIYTYDHLANVTFPATVQGTRLISSVATGTSPLAVTSTTTVTNLNSDMVDGYHSSSLWRSDGGVWNPGANITLGQTANGQEWSFDITRNGYTGGYWHVWDSALSTMLKVDPNNGKVYAPYNFVGNLEGNATTATTFATARTINGVSFNGSADITVADSTKLPLAGGTMTGAITFAAGQTWPTFNQNTSGTAAIATTVTATASSTSSGFKVPFLNTAGLVTGNFGLLHDTQATFTYNPSTNVLGVGTVSGALDGNATTATTLQTARNINGVSFNGSADITISDSTKLPLAGGTLTGRTIVNTTGRALTVGGAPGGAPNATIATQAAYAEIVAGSGGVTLSSGVIFHNPGVTTSVLEYVNTAAGIGHFNFRSDNTTWDVRINGTRVVTNTGTWAIGVTGNAATATALETARTIGGVSFNGTANINLPGVNAAGNQNTSGNAATASLISATSGGAITAWDIRTISPSSMSANRMGFGFTSWNNNSGSPYADYLHFRSYGDSSGGADNLVMFNKGAIGMRIYQQTFGSTTAYASYKDIAFTDGTNSSGTWSISTSGNAATATTLQTARTIGGVSFNGSANINLPGVNIAGTQNTSGSAGSVTSITSNTGLLRDRLAASALIDGLTTSNFRTTLFGASTSGYQTSTARWNTTPGALSGLNNYGTMFAWAGADTHGFLAVDYLGAGAIIGGGNGDLINWSKRLPFADGTGASGTWDISITGTSVSAANINNAGTVTLATAIESNAIRITQPSYTTDKPVKLLDFDWYGNTWSLGNIRSGATPSNGLGVYFIGVEKFRFQDGSFLINGNTALHSGNYTSYSPSLTGSGATGTWLINITGNAQTVSNGVYTTGTQTIAGPKTFSSQLTIATGTNTGLEILSPTGTQGLWVRTGWNANGTATPVSAPTNVQFQSSGSSGGTFSFVTGNDIKLTINGSGITCTGDVVAFSDKRVKENIRTIDNALSTVVKLRGVVYNRTDSEDKSEKIGVIAQEIQEVLPQVVQEQEDGMLGVSYGNITAVLIEAIKEQQSQIEELKELVNKLIKK